MLSTKSILIQIGNAGSGKELSKADLGRLQTHLLKIYRDIETVCRRHNIEISLAYGNVIGAIRHNGWIPWDDDLDIHMSRKDYEEFLTKYVKELPEHYLISSYHEKDGAISRFAQVIDTNTIHMPITGKNPKYAGVYVDIFPIDNVSTSEIGNFIRRYLSLFMMYTATSVIQYRSNRREYKNLMFQTRAGRLNWRIRHAWGFLFSFATQQTWHKWIEKFAQNKKETGYVHVMSDLEWCYRPIPKEYFYPFREIELPKIGKINIPNRAEEYLSLEYGDWRKIPEDADRWHHYVKEFYIPDSQEERVTSEELS